MSYIGNLLNRFFLTEEIYNLDGETNKRYMDLLHKKQSLMDSGIPNTSPEIREIEKALKTLDKKIPKSKPSTRSMNTAQEWDNRQTPSP